jgi:uncharacterized glyoxalase superfamily protein PhnB
MAAFRDAFCILQVGDVARSIDFYRQHFGFDLEYAFPEGGPPVYASLSLGGAKLAFGAADGRPSTTAASVWIYTDDLDAAHQALVAAGVTILSEPAEQPWGERVSDVADPDGYVIHLGAAA